MISVQDVLAALSSWSADPFPLIGVFETLELEFKKTAYPLATAGGKSEFAKDIAGIANAGGGLIVLGVETARDPAAGRDRSVAVHPIQEGAVNVQQMEDVAATWLYPPQRHIDIREWPDRRGRMLVSVLVPGHRDLGGFVLALGPGDPPDRHTVGIPIRSPSRTDFHTAAEIYNWVRRGRLRGETGAGTPAAEMTTDADQQLERVRSDLLEAAPEGMALYCLQAFPWTETRLEKMHDRDGVRGVFLEPPDHRWAAFGWWELPPEMDPSGGLRVTSDRISLWVTPSAVLTLAVSQDYLTWAMERYGAPGAGPLINSTALGEMTWEFVRAFISILAWAEPPPDEALFRIVILRAREPLPLRLGRGGPDSIEYSHSAIPATNDELQDSYGPVAITGEDASERIAAALLRRVYSFFGLGREVIPHLADDGQRFDPDTLKH